MAQTEIPREDIIYDHAIKVLRGGFILSAVLLAVGAIWSLIARQPLSTEVLPFRDLPGALADGDPSTVIDLSILCMMLTPVVTVLVIALNFSRLGERKFVSLTLGVLAILATSIAISVLK
jgi:uncharacterized membrane protein